MSFHVFLSDLQTKLFVHNQKNGFDGVLIWGTEGKAVVDIQSDRYVASACIGIMPCLDLYAVIRHMRIIHKKLKIRISIIRYYGII